MPTGSPVPLPKVEFTPTSNQPTVNMKAMRVRRCAQRGLADISYNVMVLVEERPRGQDTWLPAQPER